MPVEQTMLELYLLLGLAGVGYAVGMAPTNKSPYNSSSKRRRAGVPPDYPTLAPPGPSGNTIHDSTYVDHADAITRRKAHDMYLLSTKMGGGVASRNHNISPNNNIYSSLSGLTIPSGEFNHANMLPFLSGSLTQNTNVSANNTILENFAGAAAGSAVCSKKEIAPLFAPQQSAEMFVNSGGVGASTQNVDDFWQSRMVPATIRNNELPMKQVRVGPGLDPQGRYGCQPNSKTAAYEDIERKALNEKTIDQLRSVDRPKITYAGKVVGGAKTPRPGKPGATTRTIITSFKANTDADLLPTGAPYVKDVWETLPDVRDTNRMASDSYTGVAGASGRSRHPLAYGEQSLRSVKPRVEDFGVHNAVVHEGVGAEFDYGRENMHARTNERMATSDVTHMGNMGSTVRASAAPLLDEVRPTRKAFLDTDGGSYGLLQPRVPGKQELHEPNTWVARTTIKETNIHDSEWFNLVGPQRTGVYDPDDPARMTLRQTLTNDGISGEGNLHGNKFKGKAYDPDEIAKITTKQTTEHNDHDGNVDAATKRRGGYQATPYKAQRTQRAALADYEYQGVAERTAGDGYKVANFDAPRTQKQSTSQNSHIGVAGDTKTQTPMSYDDAYMANMNDFRQHLLRGRTPTTTGVKSSAGPEFVNQAVHKAMFARSSRITSGTPTARPPPIPSAAPPAAKQLHSVDEGRLDDRLDVSVLQSLRTNPYNIDITAPVIKPASHL